MIGYPQSVIRNIKLELPDASDVFIKRKLEIDEAKARVVQAVVGTGLFPMNHIYKEFYNLTDTEIEIIKRDLEKDREEQNQQESEQMAMQQQAQAAGQVQQTQAQGQTDMAVAQNQAAMDMAVADNQAKNDLKTNKPQPSVKKEETDYLVKLKQKYLLEQGKDSQQYKAIARILKNKDK
jgi:Zn-dependent M16 (insulinase) family peptidase